MTADQITCPRCGLTSHNPHDVEQGYCGHCHDWTSHPHRLPRLEPGIFDGHAVITVDPTSASGSVPPEADTPWIIHPDGTGWYAGNGITGAWHPTYREAAEHVYLHGGINRPEWGLIEASLDRLSGLSYACRHHHHDACTSPTGEWSDCACTCHQEETP